jgi:hypothetical protein
MEDIVYKIYQYIGDYLTGKRGQIFILLLVGFILLVILSFHYQIKIAENILTQVFSGIFQSLVALVALLIVASIFKLQILHDREEKIVDEMRSPSSDFVYQTGRINEVMTLEELLEEINKISKKMEQDKTSIPRRLNEIKKIAEDILLSKSLIKDFTLKFSIYTFFVVIISLIFLMFASLISIYFLGIPMLYLIFLLVTYSLFLVIKGITELLW